MISNYLFPSRFKAYLQQVPLNLQQMYRSPSSTSLYANRMRSIAASNLPQRQHTFGSFRSYSFKSHSNQTTDIPIPTKTKPSNRKVFLTIMSVGSLAVAFFAFLKLRKEDASNQIDNDNNQFDAPPILVPSKEDQLLINDSREESAKILQKKLAALSLSLEDQAKILSLYFKHYNQYMNLFPSVLIQQLPEQDKQALMAAIRANYNATPSAYERIIKSKFIEANLLDIFDSNMRFLAVYTYLKKRGVSLNDLLPTLFLKIYDKMGDQGLLLLKRSQSNHDLVFNSILAYYAIGLLFEHGIQNLDALVQLAKNQRKPLSLAERKKICMQQLQEMIQDSKVFQQKKENSDKTDLRAGLHE